MQRGVLTVFCLLTAAIPAHGQLTLIPRNATWAYLPAGPAPANWPRLEFNDRAWLSGPAKLGYGDEEENTIIPYDPQAAPTALYFRHVFAITNRAAVRSTTLRVLADDGVIVYLNGLEVVRRNLPTGTVEHATFALANIEANEDAFIQSGFYPSSLREGTNVMAAEVHQHSAGRHDAGFDLELLANIPISAPTIRITRPTNDSVLLPGNIEFETISTDAAGDVRRVVFYTNGVVLGESTVAPFGFTWSNALVGHYLVTARAYNNYYYFSDSPSVHIQVGQGAVSRLFRGPYLQSGSPTNVIVRWRTDWYADSVVRYGTNSLLQNQTVTDLNPTIDHEASLPALRPDTTYYYSVGSSSAIYPTGGSHYHTSPTNTRPVRVWVIGDSGTSDTNAARVRDAYYALTDDRHTDVWLMLGDNAYGSGTDNEYQTAVFSMYAELLRSTVVWPALGNHDAADDPGDYGNHGAPYLGLFTLPAQGEAGGMASGSELYYSFDYANIHFICLDSFLSDNSTNGPMLTWLRSDLAATEKDWIIAYWHHPPYSWGTHNSDSEYFLGDTREKFLPILEAYGVDLVLNGHSHNYERSFLLNGHYGRSWTLASSMVLDSGSGSPDTDGPYRKPSGGLGAHQGAVYAVCGCSGTGGLDEGFPRHPAMAVNHGGFGSMILEIDGLRLKASFLRPSLEIDDTFTIDKSVPAAIRPELSITSAPNGATISWPTSKPAFALEWADAIPASWWQPFPQTARNVGRQNVVRVETNGPRHFFRLRSQP
jgi:hypothetical protein